MIDRAPTQQEHILELLRARGPAGLTPLEALEEARCFRLAAVVHRLKEDGHDIETTMVTVPTGKRVARYVLHPARAHPEQIGMPW
jgi:hypothetical protein